MLQSIFKLFDTDGFPPRWYCGTAWAEEPFWGWAHIVSDVGIWGAYMAIPLVLFLFLRKRKDWPQPKLLILFSAFIFCCGLTHLTDAILFEWPIYRFSGLLKFITAAVSWTTVFTLISTVPLALSYRSPRELEVVISERTAELECVNRQLADKIEELSKATNRISDQEDQLRLALAAGRLGTWEWTFNDDLVKADKLESELLDVDFNDETHSPELIVIVEDTGVGISREDQREIFEAFAQAKQPLRTRAAGTGLGLTICRSASRLG